jgi:alkanesulfonate monooxygenase SsuD/methylene tetrahydromethanopterin reductase-like flavin-dependent oxidoreductase (luciferase family)
VTAPGTDESHARVIRNLIEQAEFAYRLGLAFFGVGEHHREDFAVSAPESCSRRSPARTSQRGSTR